MSQLSEECIGTRSSKEFWRRRRRPFPLDGLAGNLRPHCRGLYRRGHREPAVPSRQQILSRHGLEPGRVPHRAPARERAHGRSIHRWSERVRIVFFSGDADGPHHSGRVSAHRVARHLRRHRPGGRHGGVAAGEAAGRLPRRRRIAAPARRRAAEAHSGGLRPAAQALP